MFFIPNLNDVLIPYVKVLQVRAAAARVVLRSCTVHGHTAATLEEYFTPGRGGGRSAARAAHAGGGRGRGGGVFARHAKGYT